MMAELGLEIVRIAEFAWTKMEPSENNFEWGWLDEAIETLAAAGLKILLCTPTATPPAWMTRHDPSILRMDSSGRYRDHGTRKHYCPISPSYRAHSRRITQALADRYGSDPRIAGWQIDNEFGEGGTGRCFCPHCQTAFQAWLRDRYGSLDTLNDSWGTAFWSQTYTTWDQIGFPHDGVNYKNPSHLLDFYRFSSYSFVTYQQEQLNILRAASPDKFVTHNFMGLFLELEQFNQAAPLDFASWDCYPTGFPDMQRPWMYPLEWDPACNRPIYAFDAGEPEIIHMAHALMYGLKGQPFWVMEQQCGHINWGAINPQIRPGTPRLWAWHSVAAGADAVVYFRWRNTLLSHEQYHSGLLKTDGSPDVGFYDLRTLQEERELLEKITTSPPTADVALVFNYDDLWATLHHPHRHDFHYLRQLFVIFHALQRLGIPVDLVPPTGRDFSRYKVIINAVPNLITPKGVEAIDHYVNSGGVYVAGIRAGFKTDSSRVTEYSLPGVLAPLTGTRVDQWGPLPPGVTRPLASPHAGLDGSKAGYWVESLIPQNDEVEILATYASAENAEAALTFQRVGQGGIYHLGFSPTVSQAAAFMKLLAGREKITPIATIPDGVLATRRGPHTILLNFTDQPQSAAVDDVNITIPPRDVHIVESE